MTQCVLIDKEQDRKPTAAFIRTEVLLSFFPLLTVRGDAKLGFKFKISVKINVRLPFYLETLCAKVAEAGVKPKLNNMTTEVGVSLGSAKRIGV